jgi:hypothetical protein
MKERERKALLSIQIVRLIALFEATEKGLFRTRISFQICARDDSVATASRVENCWTCAVMSPVGTPTAIDFLQRRADWIQIRKQFSGEYQTLTEKVFSDLRQARKPQYQLIVCCKTGHSLITDGMLAHSDKPRLLFPRKPSEATFLADQRESLRLLLKSVRIDEKGRREAAHPDQELLRLWDSL